MQSAKEDEAMYVGGDLSRVDVVPQDEVESYHDGMRAVIACATCIGVALFTAGWLLELF